MAKLEQHGAPADPGTGLDAKGAARRRFAKVGVGASGVILTLASQPGMAANSVCTTPSGFLSQPMTSHTPRSACGGLSPGYWKNHHDQWMPRAHTDGTTKFKDVFACGARNAALASCTLFDVVNPHAVPKGSDPNNVAMHIVAALLNARAGIESVLGEAKIREIWAQYEINGYFTPTQGAKPWYGDKIVQYIVSTFVLEDQ